MYNSWKHARARRVVKKVLNVATGIKGKGKGREEKKETDERKEGVLGVAGWWF